MIAVLSSISGLELALLIQTFVLFVLICITKITWPSRWVYVTGFLGIVYCLQAMGYFMEVWMRATGNI